MIFSEKEDEIQNEEEGSMRTCQLCYREFKDEDMSKKAGGDIADHYNTCNGI